jgi:large subunit ribosomal protein L17
MRHLNSGRKFKRSPSHRRMMMRNLATALFEHGKITTTQAKAKELQPYAEKLITLACRGLKRQAKIDGDKLPLNEFRRALSVITSKQVCFKLFFEIAPRYLDRPGGYTRIYKLAKVRQGDCSAMAVISLLGAEEKVKSEPTRPAVVPAAK